MWVQSAEIASSSGIRETSTTLIDRPRRQRGRSDEMEASDAELIGRFRRGDKKAFARLAHRWDRRAYALAYRLTLNDAESADIKQAALLRAYQGLGEFNGRATFSTWLYRVVVNLCRDRRRARVARDGATQRAVLVNGPQDRTQIPGAAGERTETRRRVAEAVTALPLAIREVVIMRHYQDLPFAEIAEVVDAPVSTVKSRMARGLQLLHDALEDLK